MNTKSTFKIELTPEQQEHVRRLTGMGTSAVELMPEVLEERIAPITMKNGRPATEGVCPTCG
jgi:hypothetical protein